MHAHKTYAHRGMDSWILASAYQAILVTPTRPSSQFCCEMKKDS
jgi:hypothetical protein